MAYNTYKKNGLSYTASLNYHFNKVEAESIKVNLRASNEHSEWIMGRRKLRQASGSSELLETPLKSAWQPVPPTRPPPSLSSGFC